MTKDVLEDIITNPEIEFEPEYPLTSIEEVEGFLCINGYIGLKVTHISKEYEQELDIEIFDENDIYIGILCNYNLNYKIPLEVLTKFRYYSFIIDSTVEDFLSSNYILKNKYLIIKADNKSSYIEKYMESSMLWGKFSHNVDHIYIQPKTKNIQKIKAVAHLNFPTEIHKEIALRSLLEPYAFERFLKTYHFIELLSDYFFVKEIKELDDDLYGIGNLISGYESNELNKIRTIIENKITSIDNIVSTMELIKNYKDISTDIFQKYNKKGNLLKDDEFEKLFIMVDFKKETFVSNGLQKIGNKNYEKNIIDLATYWIYRIRCSIAHSKIGEYIFRTTDEDFVISFGQKLLDSITLEIL